MLVCAKRSAAPAGRMAAHLINLKPLKIIPMKKYVIWLLIIFSISSAAIPAITKKQ